MEINEHYPAQKLPEWLMLKIMKREIETLTATIEQLRRDNETLMQILAIGKKSLEKYTHALAASSKIEKLERSKKELKIYNDQLLQSILTAEMPHELKLRAILPRKCENKHKVSLS